MEICSIENGGSDALPGLNDQDGKILDDGNGERVFKTLARHHTPHEDRLAAEAPFELAARDAAQNQLRSHQLERTVFLCREVLPA